MKIKTVLPRFNRSALITAVLFTTMSSGMWAVRTYVGDIELATILQEGVLAIGTALGVVSNSRKGTVPTPPGK